MTAHLSYSNILRYLGRPEESIAEARRAFELDPLAVLTNEVLANAYLSARRYDLADRSMPSPRWNCTPKSPASTIYWAGRTSTRACTTRAGTQSRKALPSTATIATFSPDLAYIDSVTGNKQEARKTLGRLLALAKQAPVDPGLIALIYVGLGQRQEALPLLQQAYRRHSADDDVAKSRRAF